VAGVIEHRLEVLPHRAEDLGADVESVVDPFPLQGGAEVDRGKSYFGSPAEEAKAKFKEMTTLKDLISSFTKGKE
jgi:hypothetical protein